VKTVKRTRRWNKKEGGREGREKRGDPPKHTPTEKGIKLGRGDAYAEKSTTIKLNSMVGGHAGVKTTQLRSTRGGKKEKGQTGPPFRETRNQQTKNYPKTKQKTDKKKGFKKKERNS